MTWKSTEPNRKRKFALIFFIALSVVGAAVWTGVRLLSGKSAESYAAAAVERGDISAKITATGKLSALVTVEVGSQVSGRIKEILADYNSVVEKGQILARIDPQLFEADMAQAQAAHQAAKANLKKAEVKAVNAASEYRRAKALANDQLVTPSDLETAKMNLDSADADVSAARANLSQTRAALSQARVNLDYSTIRSPIRGIVIARKVDVGQTVAASFQAPVLFTIAEDLRRMQVDTSVAEADVGKLKDGMAVSFTVDAYPLDKFQGVVRQIRNDPQEEQNVVTYDAVVDVANDDLRLKPGMTANVVLTYDERRNVLHIPNAALRFKPSTGNIPSGSTGAGQKTVWVLADGNPAPRTVRIGLSDGTWTEVVEGDLREGEQVITGLAGASKKQSSSSAGGPPMRPF